MEQVWAGVDAGKEHHHCVVVDADGQQVLSRRVANDEQVLVELIRTVRALGGDVVWALDLAGGGAALLIGLLLAHGQDVVYIPGHAVNRASGGYRGEGKTDARDAAVIADQARMRRDLRPMRADDELVVELRMLTACRADLAADRTRAINRLRDRLLGVFPALERALDLTCQGPLILVAGQFCPAALRELGCEGLTAWLRERKVRGAAVLATKAMAAAEAQHIRLPGEQMAAVLAADLAREVLDLGRRIKATDELIESRFREHPAHEVITSLPGIGVLLGAEFLAATGGDMKAFASADHLAGLAGLAPAPRDSGKRSGNLHRPKRYHRGLQRVFYTSAMISIRCCPESRIYYDRKRAEGKRHNQAVLALARRRVNVLWALLRDQRIYQPVVQLAAAA